jgi:hypothetical protein
MNILASDSAVALRRRSAWPVLLLIILLAIVLGLMSPGILSTRNLLNILNQQASLIAVTIGQALVVLTGGLDLSVGSVVSLTTAIVSLDTPWAVPAALGALFLAITRHANLSPDAAMAPSNWSMQVTGAPRAGQCTLRKISDAPLPANPSRDRPDASWNRL